jgi:cytidylate kinase
MSAKPKGKLKAHSPAILADSGQYNPVQLSVVTISRQMGSLGYEVAKELADMLGYRLMWRELINQAALRSGKPEVALATIDELGLLGLCPSPKECKAYLKALKHVIVELADEGKVVIVGRAGQVILHNRSEVLHVRVIAPVEVRANRVALMHDISLENALAQIEASDEYRRNYLKRFYKVRWGNPELYDLVLNTARISPGMGADLIREAMQHTI